MKTCRSVLAVLLLVFVPVASGAQDAELPQPAVAAINALTDAFAAAVRARDVKRVAALYADDGVLYPPGESAVKGRAAIEACLIALPDMTAFTMRTTRVDGHGDLAYVQGTYSMTLTEPGSPTPIEESGYFVDIRRKQRDGRWLIAVQTLIPHE